MKAYRGVDDNIRMFRPMHNMARMQVSAKRACLPDFDPNELIECIRRLVQIDQEWVPHCSSSSLYIRPTFIGTDPALGVSAATVAEIFVILSPVGPYFSSGVKPVNLMADPAFVRAWPGGSGFAKMGSNYAPTLWTSVSTLTRFHIKKSSFFCFAEHCRSKQLSSSVVAVRSGHGDHGGGRNEHLRLLQGQVLRQDQVDHTLPGQWNDSARSDTAICD